MTIPRLPFEKWDWAGNPPCLGLIDSWVTEAKQIGWRYGLPKEKFLQSVWSGLDTQAEAADRPDYKLWRIMEVFNPPTDYSIRWGEIGAHCLAKSGIAHDSQVVVWGTVSLLPRLLVGRRKALLQPGQQLDILEAAAALLPNLSPVSGREAECGLLELLLRSVIQEARCELAQIGMAVGDVADYYDKIEACIRKADPQWRPGKCVSMTIPNTERRTQESRLVALPVEELTLGVHQALYRARFAANRAVVNVPQPTLDEDSRALLERAFAFAVSAWRAARASRIGIQATLVKVDWRGRKRQKMMQKEQILCAEEAGALWSVSGAALDVGD